MLVDCRVLFSSVIVVGISLMSLGVVRADQSDQTSMAVECLVNVRDRISSKSRTEENLKVFFDCFPNEFESFIAVFGYKRVNRKEIKRGPLYSNSMEYVGDLFPKTMTVVGGNKFITKLIELSQGASWDADAVNLLQMIMHRTVEAHLNEFLEVLSNYGDAQIESFWSFYFDGSHRRFHSKPFRNGVLPLNVCKNMYECHACLILKQYVDREVAKMPNSNPRVESINRQSD